MLLQSGKSTDVSFELDSEVFAAHKLILAARSPVFRAQLCGPMKDVNTKRIKVEDVEAPVFKALLHFMYWDSLPDLQELTGLDANDIMKLFHMSEAPAVALLLRRLQRQSPVGAR